MPTKRPPAPKDKIKVRASPRLPRQGDEILLRATVTRTGRNTFDTEDTVTVRIPGYPTPVTISADYLDAKD